jgi:hypothetical protein
MIDFIVPTRWKMFVERFTGLVLLSTLFVMAFLSLHLSFVSVHNRAGSHELQTDRLMVFYALWL